MNAMTTKLNLLKLENLNAKDFRIYNALLGLNKAVNETNTDVYYTIGQFVSKSITLNNGDFAKSITPNKLLNILYSYFKSDAKKYPLRLIAKQNKKTEWVICSCAEEKATDFYKSLETEDNLDRLEKSAKAKAKAKETRDAEKAKLDEICNSKNVTMEVAKSILAKEKETNKKNEMLKSFSDADLLCELLDRGIIDNADFENIKARMLENKGIA